ncbi:DDE-type integrase/transposase/recombinase, partial [Paraburkholderia sp. NMBU_R16]|nr:DDE-type integrase/transposase/recombinase [Paraburkholderia sp. NMBU_R16]
VWRCSTACWPPHARTPCAVRFMPHNLWGKGRIAHCSASMHQRLAMMLDSFPFVVRSFHSDGGSEYINHDVARLLEKLRIEFTRSRPRQTNDNALAECKNGAVVRKIMGYSHIPQKHAAAINRFHEDALNPYLNFHRPCYFALDTVDARGRIRKTYPVELIMTPCVARQSG